MKTIEQYQEEFNQLSFLLRQTDVCSLAYNEIIKEIDTIQKECVKEKKYLLDYEKC